MELTNPSLIKAILTREGIFPKKSLGQHFLVSQKVLDNLLNAAELHPEDVVLEIGAGLGTVTEKLAPKVKKVIAVEIDPQLVKILQENLRLRNLFNVEVKDEDILKINLGILPKNYKTVGSIPYQITSPLIHKILLSHPLPSLIVLLTQKEVAEKVTASPPNATYLSNFIALFGPAKTEGKTIPPSAFWPQPEVDSAILKIKVYPKKKVKNVKKFEQFLHQGFRYPRKMLNKVFKSELLKKAKINPQSRPQEITLNQWLLLYSQFKPIQDRKI